MSVVILALALSFLNVKILLSRSALYVLEGSNDIYEIFERVVEDQGDGAGEFLWPKMRRNDGKWFGFDRAILAKKRGQYLDKTQFYAQYYNNPNDPDETQWSLKRQQIIWDLMDDPRSKDDKGNALYRKSGLPKPGRYRKYEQATYYGVQTEEEAEAAEVNDLLVRFDLGEIRAVRQICVERLGETNPQIRTEFAPPVVGGPGVEIPS